MKKTESHKHFYLAENRQHFPEELFIIHMADPRCFIRFNDANAFFADYDEFYGNVASVEWIDGKPKDENLIERTMIDAYNFMVIEDRILEEDNQAMLDDDF